MDDQPLNRVESEFVEYVTSRISVFLDSVSMSPSEKEAVVRNLSGASLEELANISDQLEAILINEQTKDLDEALEQKLKSIQTESDQADGEIDSESIKELEQLAALLQE